MKIYTRTGDGGETALLGGGRVPKHHQRVEAYGEVDELNATLGLAIAAAEAGGLDAHLPRLRLLQEDLFALGAHLAAPAAGTGEGAARHLPPLPTGQVALMEEWIDELEEGLPPLRNFVLPGGSETAARFHVARAVCRRAERRVLALASHESVEAEVLVYLNRLSDLLFTLARAANVAARHDDIPWVGRA